MKIRYFAIAVTMSLVCLATGTLIGSSEQQAREKENAPTIEQLLDRIKKLEARVTRLEKRSVRIVPLDQSGPNRPTLLFPTDQMYRLFDFELLR